MRLIQSEVDVHAMGPVLTVLDGDGCTILYLATPEPLTPYDPNPAYDPSSDPVSRPTIE
jgi:hypothetical protein